ncbi:unnamed protein product [Symbiodinium necroappetens]|uniref:Uncharacterized protein n=1 Tax=Symbiodinium necroappetens TaxID=1628268 RepID=A0A812ZYW2_9DINO|nr:unnamed protein product [Symbiodinium necroappetens]
MQPYFEAESLAMVTNVDTRKASGGQFLDMGALEFAPRTDVNESLTMGYKDGNLYCVAPIVTSGGVNATAPAFFEFWAVGVNCCDPFEPKLFACGEPNDDQVRGGFRLTDTSLVPQYRKAIQMAQEEYHIRSGANPIFLHWTGDPVKKTEQQFRDGEAAFWKFCWVYLAVSAVLAFLAVGSFAPSGGRTEALETKLSSELRCWGARTATSSVRRRRPPGADGVAVSSTRCRVFCRTPGTRSRCPFSLRGSLQRRRCCRVWRLERHPPAPASLRVRPVR